MNKGFARRMRTAADQAARAVAFSAVGDAAQHRNNVIMRDLHEPTTLEGFESGRKGCAVHSKKIGYWPHGWRLGAV